MDRKQIGRALKELREQKGLTQFQAATLAGITPVSIARYEAGRQIKFVTLAKISAVYGVVPHIEFKPVTHHPAGGEQVDMTGD